MSKRRRSYFFSFPRTSSGIGFNKNNKPTEILFKDFLDSVPFHTEEASEGSPTQRGLFMRASKAEVQANSVSNKAVMPYQLPQVFAAPGTETENPAGEITGGGLGIYSNIEGENLKRYLRLRMDTLVKDNTIYPDKDYIPLIRDYDPLNKNRQVRAPINALINLLGGNAVVQALFESPLIIFQEGNSNKMVYKILNNGELYSLTSTILQNSITVSASEGVTFTKNLNAGKLEIVITNAPTYVDSNITVTFNGLINEQEYNLVTQGIIYRDESIANYNLTVSNKVINLGGTYPESATTEIRILDKNGTSISFAKSVLDLTQNTLPDHITFDHTKNDNSTIHTLTFTLDSSTRDSNPSNINIAFMLYVKAFIENLFDLTETISVLDKTQDTIYNLNFIPDSYSIPIDPSNEGVNIHPDTAYVKLLLTENGVPIVPDLDKLVIPTSASYNVGTLSIIETHFVKVPILTCSDSATLIAIYDNNDALTAYCSLGWRMAYEIGDDNITLKPDTIIFPVDTLLQPKSLSTAVTDAYLIDSAGVMKDLLTTETIIQNPAGVTFTKTEMIHSNGKKYVRIAITAWDNLVDDRFNVTVTYQKTGATALPAVMGIVKTRDGAVGDPFAIDAQGSGVPTGAGMIAEDPGYTYLDTDDSKVYFKIGAAGVDTWTAGIPFGKGETGATGPAPAHNVNGTLLSFQNPDGSWGEEFDTKGDQGEAGLSKLPYQITVHPTTGRLSLYFDNGEDPDTVLTTTGSVIGPPGESITGAKGEDGASINWLGNLPDFPVDPTLNDAFRNTDAKKSYIYTQAGTWSILAEDGESPVSNIPKSLANEAALTSFLASNTISADDVGTSIYLVAEQVNAVIHYVTAAGVGSVRYSAPLESK